MSSVPFDASSRRSPVDYQNTASLIYSFFVKLLTKIIIKIKNLECIYQAWNIFIGSPSESKET